MRVAAFGQVLRLSEIQNNITSGRSWGVGSLMKVSASHWSTRKGIFKPKRMRLSCYLSQLCYPSPGKRVWYEDQLQAHNQIFESREAVDYAFMGKNPDAADNRWLREALENRIPVIYFLGVAPGRFIRR